MSSSVSSEPPPVAAPIQPRAPEEGLSAAAMGSNSEPRADSAPLVAGVTSAASGAATSGPTRPVIAPMTPTRSEAPRTLASREPQHGGGADTTAYRLWQDVDVDAVSSASAELPGRTAAASVGGSWEQRTRSGRWTDVVAAFAMAAAVALCALLGIVFGDSSDSGLAGAAVALIVGALCGAVIGLCYRWHDESSPI